MALATPPPVRTYKPSTRINRAIREGFLAWLDGDADRIKAVNATLGALRVEVGQAISDYMTANDGAIDPYNQGLAGKIARARYNFVRNFETEIVNQISNTAQAATESWLTGIEGYHPYAAEVVWGISERTVEAMRKRQLGAARIPLSGRIWRVGADLNNGINQVIVTAALVHGQFPPPRELAKILEGFILPGLDVTARDLAKLYGPDWRANPVAADLYARKKPAWQALRLARTETIQTFHTATELAAEATPGVIGTRCVLSNTHHARMPKGDICNVWAEYRAPNPPPRGAPEFDPVALAALLAERAPDESRAGVFPAGRAPLEHPNGMCTRLYVLADLDKLEGLFEKVKPLTPPVGTEDTEAANLDADLGPAPIQAQWSDRIHEILSTRSGGQGFFKSKAIGDPDRTAYAEEALVREAGRIVDEEARRRLAERGFSRDDFKALELETANSELELQHASGAMQTLIESVMWQKIKESYGETGDARALTEARLTRINDQQEALITVSKRYGTNLSNVLTPDDVESFLNEVNSTNQSSIYIAPDYYSRAHFEREITNIFRSRRVSLTRQAYGYADLAEFRLKVGETSDEYFKIEDAAQDSPEVLAAEKAKSVLGDKYGKLLIKLVDTRKAIRPATRDTYLEVLSELRPMGLGRELTNLPTTVDTAYLLEINQIRVRQGLPLQSMPELQRDVDKLRGDINWAAQFYPRDWLEEFEHTSPAVHLGYVDRGHAMEAAGTPHRGGRIVISNKTPGIATDPNAAPTLVHELGHHQEFAVPDITTSEWAFYHRRTRGGVGDPKIKQEAKIDISTIPGHGHYKKGELTRPDQFEDVYMGKEYAVGRTEARELLTVGMESVFTRSLKELENDTDMRHWLLGTLVTAARKDQVTYNGPTRPDPTANIKENPIQVSKVTTLRGDKRFTVWHEHTGALVAAQYDKYSLLWTVYTIDLKAPNGRQVIGTFDTQNEARDAAIIHLGGTPPKRGRPKKNP